MWRSCSGSDLNHGAAVFCRLCLSSAYKIDADEDQKPQSNLWLLNSVPEIKFQCRQGMCSSREYSILLPFL
jgi:hypothetical protein